MVGNQDRPDEEGGQHVKIQDVLLAGCCRLFSPGPVKNRNKHQGSHHDGRDDRQKMIVWDELEPPGEVNAGLVEKAEE